MKRFPGQWRHSFDDFWVGRRMTTHLYMYICDPNLGVSCAFCMNLWVGSPSSIVSVEVVWSSSVPLFPLLPFLRFLSAASSPLLPLFRFLAYASCSFHSAHAVQPTVPTGATAATPCPHPAGPMTQRTCSTAGCPYRRGLSPHVLPHPSYGLVQMRSSRPSLQARRLPPHVLIPPVLWLSSHPMFFPARPMA